MNKFLRTILPLLAFASLPPGVWGQNGVPADAHQLGGNLYAYPWIDEAPVQTPPPAGYEPFHMEHYSRHGSRWLIGPDDYLVPVRNLERAERHGLLTPLGDTVLNVLRNIRQASLGREGELTDMGAKQHQAIGRRMARNFPQIFNDSADIDAKSTVVIRCILSMLNGLEGIGEAAPGVRATSDASQADMWFMNFDDKTAWPHKDRAEKEVVDPFRARHAGSGKFLDRLVADPDFARDSVAPGLMPRLYWVLANAQGHSDQPWLLEDVFDLDELQDAWRGNNAFWFIHSADTPLTDRRMPYTQRMLLGRMIEQADKAIATGRHGARLRYGHDGILVNLVVLMELEDYAKPITDLETLPAEGWREFEIIPMGGNLQLVFYRNPSDGDGLVKALLNEREVRMPGTPVAGPYYRWPELRNHYLKKLSAFSE